MLALITKVNNMALPYIDPKYRLTTILIMVHSDNTPSNPDKGKRSHTVTNIADWPVQ